MKKNVKKVILTVLSVALIVALSVPAPLAWLQDTTKTVTNTFAVGDINIDLVETVGGTSQSAATADVTNDGFKIVPGAVESKDPKVIVEENSEDSFVFVKVEESNVTVDGVTYVTYTIADGWKVLDATKYPGVYYREYTGDAKAEYPILTGNQVSYSKDLTKAQLEALGTNKPSLKFTAYAIQKQGEGSAVFTAADAWAALNP